MSTVSLDQILAAGRFKPPDPLRPRLILELSGMDKSGKSRFGLTGPEPILYQSIDFGTEGLVQQPEFASKKILVAKYIRPVGLNRRDTDSVKAAFKPVIEQFEADFRQAVQLPRGTIIWDTETELWEMIQLAFHGKVAQVPPLQRGVSNGFLIELVRAAEQSNMNLILLRQQKDEWENYEEGGDKKSRTTGRKIPVGNEKTQFLVQGRLETRRIPQRIIPAKYAGGILMQQEQLVPQKFELEFKAVRHNAALNGVVLENESINFPTVAMMIAPEVPVEAWL